MRAILSLLLAVSIAAACLGADALDTPVVGLTPTTASLAQVLAAYKAAAAAGRAVASHEKWRISSGGLTGTADDLYDGRNYLETTQLGPFLTREGRIGTQAWKQNDNGYTVLMHGAHKMDEISRTALADSVDGKSSNFVKLLGEVTAPVPAYVVEVAPPEGRRKWLYFDKSSGALVRSAQLVEGRHYVTTYDDFRTTGGVRRAWHLHDTDGRSSNDYDAQLLEFTVGRPSDSKLLAIPTDRRVVVNFPAGKSTAAIPVSMIDGIVIVRVNINGRGLDFQLDSGSDGIVLDSNVTQQLGLATYGTVTSSVAGTFTEHRAIVPTMKIGDLTIHDIAVSSLPFDYQPEDQVKIVGLLGFDFIADEVLHIDYVHQSVAAIDSSVFKPPADAIAVPIDLDDQIPFLYGAVGDADSPRFVLDTGAAATTLFSTFANAHPADVRDLGEGKDLRLQFGFVNTMGGVGGDFRFEPAEVKNLTVGPMKFGKWLLDISQAPPSFEGDDLAGLIGQDFLVYFDVYLDYADSLIYLVPNDTFKKTFKSAN
ncbi:MAG: aspartyl protease family protein [Candidatus Baltobacteraceae bacterium]